MNGLNAPSKKARELILGMIRQAGRLSIFEMKRTAYELSNYIAALEAEHEAVGQYLGRSIEIKGDAFNPSISPEIDAAHAAVNAIGDES